MDGLDEEIVFVVKRIAKAVSKHGVKKVVAVLDKLNSEQAFIDAHRDLISFVIKETTDKFMVNPEDLKRKNARGMVVEARSMCIVLIKKHVNLNHEDIAGLFGSTNHSVVSSAIRKFNDLSYDIKTDRRIIDVFTEIDKKTKEYKEILWLKHS